MAGIDRFTKADFEKALPANCWTALGIIKGEETYIVKPTGIMAGYGIMVRSSVSASGIADDCGEDSIRVIFARQEGESWRMIGNKAKAYTTRVNGWQRRLMESLQAAKAHLQRVRQCPKCKAQNLLPFVSKKGKAENKGRGFVSCPDKQCGFFEWIDEEPQAPQPPATEKPVSEKTPTVNSPTCPLCKSGMIRNRIETGWRCNTPGNVYSVGARTWSICQGVIWDSAKPLPAKTPTVNSPIASNVVKSVREVIELAKQLGSARENAIALLAGIDGGDMAQLVDMLIDAGNLQAERIDAACHR